MTQSTKSEQITYVPGPDENGWKGTAARLLQASGLLSSLVKSTASALLRNNQYRCAILYYHRIGTGGVPVYNGIPADVFESQIRFLRQNYRIISLAQFCQEFPEGKVAEPSVVITFDDGYRGTYTEALPILQKYSVPATVYLTVGCIETGDIAWYDKIFLAFYIAEAEGIDVEVEEELLHFPLSSLRDRLGSALRLIRRLRQIPNVDRIDFCRKFDKQFPLPSTETRGRMLTWEEARQMQKLGISFGGHTMTHPAVSQLSPPEAEIELGESKAIAEKRLGQRVVDFAFPFGNLQACGTGTPALLKKFEYRSATTTMEGVNSGDADPFLLRRTAVIEEAGVSLAMFRLNQLFRRGSNERLTQTSAAQETQASLREMHA
ncbi:MAG TPA: polysaccharide deacetylase family protein [Terriglobales bacterium]|nr:polysaccharide deacetylase family protein [Terriglobales bacterium]